MIAVIAIMLTTGVAAFGLNNADDGGSGLSDHGSHSKISHEKKSVNSDKNKDSDESSGDITLDVTMQQNVNNYLFNIPTAFILAIIATLGACGASGVAGGSLLLIPLACSLFGIGNDVAMQAVAVGFIIGVVQDSLETAINSSGDVMFAATAEFMEWKKQGKEIKF